jgi:hypothetical protein
MRPLSHTLFLLAASNETLLVKFIKANAERKKRSHKTREHSFIESPFHLLVTDTIVFSSSAERCVMHFLFKLCFFGEMPIVFHEL